MSTTTTTTTTPDTAARSGALLADATRLGGVELAVTDLDRSLDFYTRVIGLTLRERGDGVAALGAGGEDLVTLHADPAARPAHGSGLYHYALLFPSREELAHAGRRVAESATPIDGASDHGTHEAIYLPDPDGIGIELAADRPRERWPDVRSGALFSAGPPQPLDIGGLFETVAQEPTRPLADRALTMGHVHLHVDDLDAASRFYIDGLGFELMMGLPTARFVSAGGYHHHVAYNVWRGVGAPAAPAGAIGLRHWTLVTAGAAEHAAVRERLSALGVALEERDGGATLARDPFGIAVLIR
jgi:catechol 2,3-dioxygenase